MTESVESPAENQSLEYTAMPSLLQFTARRHETEAEADVRVLEFSARK